MRRAEIVKRASGVLIGAAAALAVASAPAQAGVAYGRVGSLGAEELSNPVGVAVDQESGDVYAVSLLFGGVGKFSAGGESLAHFDASPYLSGTAVDPANGNVYVVNAAEQAIETYARGGEQPISRFSVEGSANLFESLTVVQIASDAAGDVYLPNAPNDEVQEFSPSGVLLQTFDGSGASALSEPTGVAVDSPGNVYVADRGNGRIEEFSPGGAPLGSIAAPGVEAVALERSGDILAGELNEEDACGSLSSPCFHVVLYSPAGVKLADFGAGAIGTSEFEAINTLAVGPTGLVYVADGANNVVWIYAPQSEPSLLEVSSFAVAQTTAILRAEIDPGNLDTTYHFEYGPCATANACPGSSYTASTPVPDADIGNGLPGGPAIVSQQLAGLQPGTVYHYRAVAANADGETIGAEQTFSTPASQPPIVASGQALGVAQTSATLAGTVETQGFQTKYEFDVGTDTGYGVRIFGDAGAAPGTQTFSAPLQGLASGTTYHYRIVATNIFGTTYGADQTFTTATYSTATLTAPTAPPLIPAILLAPAGGASTGGTAHAASIAHTARRRGARRGERSHRAGRHGKRRGSQKHASRGRSK